MKARQWQGLGRSKARSFRSLICFVFIAALNVTPTPTDAYSSISQKKGFDTCAAPSKSAMKTWWSSSPFWNIGIYIGGANRGCSQPNLTPSWVTYVQTAGQGGSWRLLPIWFGRQMPNDECQTDDVWATEISLNTTTAFNQGYAEAQAAFSAAYNLGLNMTDAPIIYDLEGYGGGTSSLTTCKNAAKAFIDGWDSFLQSPPPQLAGIYGSDCGSYLNGLHSIANPPDFIWFANWDLEPSTSIATCTSSSNWDNIQRHKQYRDGHNVTYGGVTIHIDNDCSNGRVYFPTNILDPSSPCL